MKDCRVYNNYNNWTTNSQKAPYRSPFAQELEMDPDWVLCVSGSHESIEEEDWVTEQLETL